MAIPTGLSFTLFQLLSICCAIFQGTGPSTAIARQTTLERVPGDGALFGFARPVADRS